MIRRVEKVAEAKPELRAVVGETVRDYDRLRIRLGRLLDQVQREGLDRAWGFQTFGEYVQEECHLGERIGRCMIEVSRELLDRCGISVTTLEEIGWSKAYVLAAFLRRRSLEPAKIAEAFEEARVSSFSALRQKYFPQEKLFSVEEKAFSEKEKSLLVGPMGMPALADFGDEVLRATYLGRIAASLLVAPRRRWPQRPEDFVISEDHWQQLCYSIDAGKHTLILGPSGCGKTEIVKRCAATFGRPVEAFNFGAMTEPRTSLVGTMHYDPAKGTHFSESRFVRALRTPGQVLLLDEINRCQPEAYNLLLPILDGQRYVSLDEQEGSPVVEVADVVCFATANVGTEYPGVEPIDKALKDRFPTVIPMWFPSVQEETQLLLRRVTGLAPAQADLLCRFAQMQRKQWKEGEFRELISTRALINAAEQMAHGFTLEKAITYCVTNHFSGESGELSDRTKLKQLLQRLT